MLYRLLTGRMKGQAFITLPGEKQLLSGTDQTADCATMFSLVFFWQTLRRPREPCSWSMGTVGSGSPWLWSSAVSARKERNGRRKCSRGNNSKHPFCTSFIFFTLKRVLKKIQKKKLSHLFLFILPFCFYIHILTYLFIYFTKQGHNLMKVHGIYAKSATFSFYFIITIYS